MRESALFLLSLLVVVSVGVRGPAIYSFTEGLVCSHVHMDISYVGMYVWPTKGGADGFHRGNTSASIDLFFDSR